MAPKRSRRRREGRRENLSERPWIFTFDQWLKVAGLLIALVAALGLKDLVHSLFWGDVPKFEILANRDLSPGAAVIDPNSGYVFFIAANRQAEREEEPIILFDSVPSGSLPQAAYREYAWEFRPSDPRHALTERALAEGVHQVALRFRDGAESESMVLEFDTTPMSVAGRTVSEHDKGEYRVEGVAKTSPGEGPVTVDILFNIGDQLEPMRYPMEVLDIEETEDGVYYRFRADFKGLPVIAPSDPRFRKPFFFLRVRDHVGHTYFSRMSYSKFVAAGEETFGLDTSARVTLEPRYSDTGAQIYDISVAANPRLYGEITSEDGSVIPPTLEIAASADMLNILAWENIEETSRDWQNHGTTVVRNGERLDVVFEDRYIDFRPPKEAQYKVVQRGSDGKFYESNRVVATKVAEQEGNDSSKPLALDLDVEQINRLLKDVPREELSSAVPRLMERLQLDQEQEAEIVSVTCSKSTYRSGRVLRITGEGFGDSTGSVYIDGVAEYLLGGHIDKWSDSLILVNKTGSGKQIRVYDPLGVLLSTYEDERNKIPCSRDDQQATPPPPPPSLPVHSPSPPRRQKEGNATQVLDIEIQPGQGETKVIIQLDGDLSDREVIHDALRFNALREQIGLLFIELPYRQNTIRSNTSELSQIRIGLHRVDNGVSELRLVFDLAAEGLSAADYQVLGDRVEIVVR